MEKRYIGFKPEAFQNVRTAVIDGDGFAWAIGWIFKEALSNKEVTDAVDNCIHDILTGVQAEHYIGVLGPKSKFPFNANTDTNEDNWSYDLETGMRDAVPNFRKAIAKSRPYKGNRPDRPDWYLKWSSIIEQYLEETWGFVRTPEGFEADDLVATFMTELTSAGAKPICCGNDKDLLQIPGEHFNVVKKGMQTVDVPKAHRTLWLQVLTGDTTDHIEGIPGCGPKGAEKIIGGAIDLLFHNVMAAFVEKFGEDTGIQKFYESYMLVKLRADVPTDCFDIERICCGYDLEYWNSIKETASELVEQIEVIPDFLQGLPLEEAVNLQLISDLKEFEQNHAEDHLEIKKGVSANGRKI